MTQLKPFPSMEVAASILAPLIPLAIKELSNGERWCKGLSFRDLRGQGILGGADYYMPFKESFYAGRNYKMCAYGALIIAACRADYADTVRDAHDLIRLNLRATDYGGNKDRRIRLWNEFRLDFVRANSKDPFPGAQQLDQINDSPSVSWPMLKHLLESFGQYCNRVASRAEVST